MSILRSKTINFSALLAIMGVVESQWPIIAPMLGAYQGLSYIVIAAIVAALRAATTKPLKDK